ncbi:MAG: RlmE family RNA methyltransferase [Proteobacteria bacterium]|nr:RlmE family RNA methyltransferase [Pseudomonadota bacterium]MBU1740479.1 RlmE family RNA methyltransferase [Pseudomonadota bacterium]
MDRRHSLLRPGDRVLDLGCHPGSWLKYAADRVGRRGRVIGVDLEPTPAAAANVRTVAADVFALEPESLGPDEFDVVLSDMAPSTIGHAFTDAARSAALAERALELALRLLKPGGRFVAKIFLGEGEARLRDLVRGHFGRVKFAKPTAVRRRSREVYLIALDRRGREGAEGEKGEK